jgi:AcrR family transcriptional regulator
MALQARAEATRRRIIESAVELFAELGYGETGLADVLQHAGVSKGAFYYHFDSKEAVATAIIEEFDNRVGRAIDNDFDVDGPTLEGLIAGTFAVQDLMRRDKLTQVGHRLCQALDQVSSAGARVYLGWTERFVDMVKMVIDTGDMREDVDPNHVAECVWVGILGCNLVSAAIGDDPYARLARCWRVMVRTIVPEGALDGVEKTVDGIAGRYQPEIVAV